MAEVTNKEFGRLVPSDVATTLPCNHDVKAAFDRFKTTQTDEYFLTVSLARASSSVEGAMFDMYLRGWIDAGGKVG